MPVDPNIPLSWPLDPVELPTPPVAAAIPTTMDELDLIQLAEAAALLKILCGRGVPPLKEPKRAILCVLATILNYELYKRHHGS